MLVNTSLDDENTSLSLCDKLHNFKHLLNAKTNSEYAARQLRQVPIEGISTYHDDLLSQKELLSQPIHKFVQEFYRVNQDAARKNIIELESRVNPLLEDTINGQASFLEQWKKVTHKKRTYKFLYESEDEELEHTANMLVRLSLYAEVARPGWRHSEPLSQASTGLLVGLPSCAAIHSLAENLSFTLPVLLSLPFVGLYGGLQDQKAAIKAGDEELNQLHEYVTTLF